MATSTSFRLRAPKPRPSKSETVSEHLREKCLHQGRSPTTKNKRRKCFILYKAKTAYRWSKHMISQDLNDSNKLQQTIDPFLVSKIPVSLTFHGQFDELRSPHRPFLVSKMTNFGTQDTIVYHFWYTKRPFLVTWTPMWPFLVSKIPVSLTFHGQFDELRSPHRPILVHNLCKKRTNYGQNNANFAPNQSQNNTTFAPNFVQFLIQILSKNKLNFEWKTTQIYIKL